MIVRDAAPPTTVTLNTTPGTWKRMPNSELMLS